MLNNNELENILSKSGSRLYFVGIGGIAMSAAACVAAELGYEVSGSDSGEIYSPAKDVLEKFKIAHFAGYSAENVKSSKAELFILSAGENLDNPEVKYIEEKNLSRTSFPELLYQLSKEKLRMVVAGTHGKTTTSGLLGHLLKNLDNSSFLAGGVLQNYGSNFYLGDGHYFLFEGDEYKSQFDDPTPKFQYYKPDILILTNLEYDHPDMFESFEALEAEFRLLIEKMPEDGLIVYNADDAALTKLVNESNLTNAGFAIDNEADFKVEEVDYGADFTTIEIKNKFSKTVSSQMLGQTEQYKIQLPGKINVYNSLAAITTLRTLGFTQEQIALDLLTYRGIKRRFELVGAKSGIIIIDDYAHHPTAVRETLEAARLRYPKAKIWAVFEPHTFSRTKATLDDLSKSFGSADQILIADIYPAREKASNATVTSKDVVKAIQVQYSPPFQGGVLREAEGGGWSKNVRLVHNKEEALDTIKAEAKEDDVVIVMAVGNFNRLAYDLKEKL